MLLTALKKFQVLKINISKSECMGIGLSSGRKGIFVDLNALTVRSNASESIRPTLGP